MVNYHHNMMFLGNAPVSAHQTIALNKDTFTYLFYLYSDCNLFLFRSCVKKIHPPPRKKGEKIFHMLYIGLILNKNINFFFKFAESTFIAFPAIDEPQVQLRVVYESHGGLAINRPFK